MSCKSKDKVQLFACYDYLTGVEGTTATVGAVGHFVADHVPHAALIHCGIPIRIDHRRLGYASGHFEADKALIICRIDGPGSCKTGGVNTKVRGAPSMS